MHDGGQQGANGTKPTTDRRSQDRIRRTKDSGKRWGKTSSGTVGLWGPDAPQVPSSSTN